MNFGMKAKIDLRDSTAISTGKIANYGMLTWNQNAKFYFPNGADKEKTFQQAKINE